MQETRPDPWFLSWFLLSRRDVDLLAEQIDRAFLLEQRVLAL